MAIPSNTYVTVDSATRTGSDEYRAEECELFLCSSRALPVLTREFESLITEVARHITALGEDVTGVKAEVRRAPSRCIVQLGPFGLTLSWVRARTDRVFDGRLMIIEWQGTVARGVECIPERTQDPRAGKSATVIREAVLVAEATGGEDWLWRKEGAPIKGYTSRELAELCVNSLASMLREHQQVGKDNQIGAI